jgi:hypothetical protein
MLKESADQSQFNAELGVMPATANHAMQVMSLLKDNVFKILTHSFPPPTIFALFGKEESVLNVLKELSLIQMESAKKFQLNARPGMHLMDYA